MARRRQTVLQKALNSVIVELLVVALECILVVSSTALQVIVEICKFVLTLPTAMARGFMEGFHNGMSAPTTPIVQEVDDTYNKALDKLRKLLSNTENKLYYEIVKSDVGNGRIREYVNFYGYCRETVTVDNINELVNEVFDNKLITYKGRSERLNNTIVLEDYMCDMKDITNNLSKKLDEEIKLVMS